MRSSRIVWRLLGEKVWKFCEWRQRSRLCFALDHNWATLINLLPQCSQCRDGKFQKRQTCDVSFFVKGTPLDNFFKNEFENSFKHSTKTSNNKWQNLKKGLQNLGSDMFGRLGADRFCFQVRCFGWEFNLALWKPSWGPWEPWRFWVRPGCRAQQRKWGSLQEGDGETFFEIMKLSRSRKSIQLHIQLYNIHAWEYDNKIQPVPGVSKVGVVVQDEPLGDDFDHHFHRVDGQEDNSAIVKLVSVKLFLQISQMWQLP